MSNNAVIFKGNTEEQKKNVYGKLMKDMQNVLVIRDLIDRNEPVVIAINNEENCRKLNNLAK